MSSLENGVVGGLLIGMGSSCRLTTFIRPVAKAISASYGSGRSLTMEALRSPPLSSVLASSRQVTPDGHTTEAQPLGDLSDGQALLAEEDRLGTVFVGEAAVAFQPCLPAQPVDRRAVDARLPDDLLDGDASAVQVDHLLALLRRQGPELRLLDAVDHTRRPWHCVGCITLTVRPLPHAAVRCGASSLQGLTFWLCRICPVKRPGLVRIAHCAI